MIVDMRGGERRTALGALFTLLGITAGHTLLETARDALFLARLPASRLPWVYLGIAAAGVLLSRVNARGKARGGTSSNVVVALVVSSAVTAGFWIASASPNALFLYALYLWSGLFASWVVVQFWLLLGGTYAADQAKRLYGFIGAGSILGAVGGAGVARGLAAILDARHLLLGAAALFLAAGLGPALLVIRKVTRDAPAPARARDDDDDDPSAADDLRLATRDPFIKRILALVLLSTIALTIVDYLFKSRVAKLIPHENLGQFFANVNIGLNTAALVAQLVGVGWILRTLGVHRALWVMPCLLFLGSGYFMASSGIFAALLLKGADGTFRHSLHRTSTELLYVPIAEATRARAKPFIDLVGQRGGQAVASVAILIFASLHAGSKSLAVVVALLSAAWILVAAGIRRPYLDVFRATLREGKVAVEGELPTLDREALETLFAALSSSKVPEVLGALDLLAAYERERLIPPLILYHPSSAVVLRALDLFAKQGRHDFLPIATWLDGHADAEVRSAALRARSTVEGREELLRGFLQDRAPEVQATALVGLVSRGFMDADAAREALPARAEHASPAVRIALARAIYEDPSPRFADTLLAMVKAKEVLVVSEVARAMGRLGDARFLPSLRDLLPLRQQGIAAREALVAMGEPALAFLTAGLWDMSLPIDTRANLPRAIAMFAPAKGAQILLDRVALEQDGMMRFRILRGLCKLRDDDPTLPLDGNILAGFAEGALHSAFRSLDWRLSLIQAGEQEPAMKTRAFSLLTALLRDKETYATSRLFRILGLLYPGESFGRIQRGLQSRSAKTRASSRELIENVVLPPIKDPILTLVDDLPDAERMARSAAFHPRQELGYEDLLRALIDHGGEVQSLAAYHAAERGLDLGTRRSHRPKAEGAFSDAIARALENLGGATRVADVQ